MKKMSFLVAALFMFCSIFAQIRKVPASVTDAFKSRYPHAESVEWRDKLTGFEASFTLNDADITASFANNGDWKSSEAKINYESLPPAVKDGFTKSKYAEWEKGTIKEIQQMGKPVQYRIYAEKSEPFQKRFLYFNADGRLVKDGLGI